MEPVIAALKENGSLMQSGLFENPADGTTALRDLLELSQFGQRVFTRPYATRADLFNVLLEPLPAPADAQPLQWPALAAQQRTVQAVLATALAHAEAGVNILLYGPPGTGKTEFARQLAHSLSCRAYEVACRDDDGDEATRGQRLCSLRTAQSLLGGTQSALLVLDEAEDVFQDDGKPSGAARVGSKAWMNKLLESNPHPVLWITNSIAAIDPAYRRRFTFSIRFDVPDLAARRHIAQRHLQPVGVSDATIDCIARRSELTPALIASGAKVVRLAAGHAGTQDEVALCYLDSQGKLMRTTPALNRTPQPVTRFDTAYLRIGGRFTPEQVVDAITRHGRGTVLMSGPPGTGKTQLAGRIAERLERELQYYSASDVNSKWFGESEQQVADMFASCDPERQLIFLDEAETLLSERASAMHRASEAVTAEFLRQLESFNGVFLCATNHGGTIDSALMRRFVFRLEFRPLSGTQREQLLRELIAWPAQQELPRSALQLLEQLDGLTPGDFANVKKRFTLLGLEAALDDWLVELRQEWQVKPHAAQARMMGFV
jgi:SpoVK/Ycf46/Vps4 family AAA+-type ATPase